MSVERAPDLEPSVSELSAAAPQRPSRWRHADFMKMWTGQTNSHFGAELKSPNAGFGPVCPAKLRTTAPGALLTMRS